MVDKDIEAGAEEEEEEEVEAYKGVEGDEETEV